MNYATIRNPKTNERTVVPRHVLRHWVAKGWVEDSKPSPRPRPKADEVTPVETSSPESSNDTKEND